MAIVKSTNEVNGEEIVIYIEVDEPSLRSSPYQDSRSGTLDRSVKSVSDLFSKGLSLARNCAAEVIDSIGKMNEAIQPDEFEVQLAINLDTEVGAFIAKTSVGGQMQITMKWKLKEASKE